MIVVETIFEKVVIKSDNRVCYKTAFKADPMLKEALRDTIKEVEPEVEPK